MLVSKVHVSVGAVIIWMACADTRLMVTSKPCLCAAIEGLWTQIWPYCSQRGDKLISVAPDTIKGHAEARGLGNPPGSMVASEARMLLRTMFKPMVLPLLGSVMSVAYGATKGHTNA